MSQMQILIDNKTSIFCFQVDLLNYKQFMQNVISPAPIGTADVFAPVPQTK
jgi:hypothetical protein